MSRLSIISLSLIFSLCISAGANASAKKTDVLVVKDFSGSMEIYTFFVELAFKSFWWEVADRSDPMHNQHVDVQLAVLNDDFAFAPETVNFDTYASPTIGSADWSEQSSLTGLYHPKNATWNLLKSQLTAPCMSPSTEPTFETLVRFAKDPSNSRIVRSDADLVIILVTDEDNKSNAQIIDVSRELKKLKGPQQSVHVLVYAPDSKSTCFHSATYKEPYGLKALATETNGEFVDLCGQTAKLIEKTLPFFY